MITELNKINSKMQDLRDLLKIDKFKESKNIMDSLDCLSIKKADVITDYDKMLTEAEYFIK